VKVSVSSKFKTSILLLATV